MCCFLCSRLGSAARTDRTIRPFVRSVQTDCPVCVMEKRRFGHLLCVSQVCLSGLLSGLPNQTVRSAVFCVRGSFLLVLSGQAFWERPDCPFLWFFSAFRVLSSFVRRSVRFRVCGVRSLFLPWFLSASNLFCVNHCMPILFTHFLSEAHFGVLSG